MGEDPYAIFFEGKAVKGVRSLFEETFDRAIFNGYVAGYLGIKAPTLRSWIKNPKNEVPAHKIGRLWKFKRSEIDEWVNSGKSGYSSVISQG